MPPLGVGMTLYTAEAEVRDEIDKLVRECTKDIEVNWKRFTIQLEQSPTAPLSPPSYTSPSFNAKPVRAWLSSPTHGEIDVPIERLEVIDPRLLVALVTIRHLLGKSSHSSLLHIENGTHEPVLIPGRTYVQYADKRVGVVIQGEGLMPSTDVEFVVSDGPSFDAPTDARRYTYDSFQKEQAMQMRRAANDGVADYGYLPRRYDDNGQLLEAPIEGLDVTTDAYQTLMEAAKVRPVPDLSRLWTQRETA